MVWLQQIGIISQQNGALNHTFQFTHVAGEVITLQRLLHCVRELHTWSPIAGCDLLNKRIRQLENIALQFTGAARVDLAVSSLQAEGRDRGKPRPLDLRLGLTRPAPYRVYFLDAPPRLVVDFRQLDFTGTEARALTGAELVPALRWGRC